MRSAIAVLAALSVLPACLGPRVDASRYFTLPAAGAPSTGKPVASLGLGPLTLPPYLSRPEVATRLGPQQIAYSTNDRWAAPLEDLAFQALSEELRARLPAREVLRWPWPLGAPPEVGVSVEFLRLEADAAGGGTIHARWTVSARGRAPVTGETRLHEAGAPGDVPGSVAALGRALGALAADLAAAARAPGG
jgi:uncharacterized lipoprotein YmbA